jgi:hypothetical protein
MSLRFSWFVPIVTIALTSGCIPVPVQEEEPFSEDALGFLEAGVTTRETVESRLGKPDAERAGTSIGVYFRYRTTALLISPVNIGTAGTNHLLIVRYDADGLVRYYEIFRMGLHGWSGHTEVCTKNLLCVDVNTAGDIVVFDLPTKDSEAKLFETDEERCSVYLFYTDYSGLASNSIDVCPLQNNSRSYAVNEGGFVHWMASPGLVVIGANTWQQTSGSCSFEYEFECEAGHLYFIHAHEQWHVWGGNDITFSSEDEETAKPSVSERRLILL